MVNSEIFIKTYSDTGEIIKDKKKNLLIKYSNFNHLMFPLHFRAEYRWLILIVTIYKKLQEISIQFRPLVKKNF